MAVDDIFIFSIAGVGCGYAAYGLWGEWKVLGPVLGAVLCGLYVGLRIYHLIRFDE